MMAARVFGAVMMVLGGAGWWYNGYLARTEGEFWIKLCVFVPLALAGGLLMAVKPEWAGPWQPENSRGQKMVMIAVLAFMAIGSGVEFFRLQSVVAAGAPEQKIIRWSPEMGKPPKVAVRQLALPLAMASMSAGPEITFMGRKYQLGSHNAKANRMWEFVTGGETVNNWTTLLTLIDRPDAKTRPDLDRLSEGILTAYKSRGGKVLMAKTMGGSPETVYNYAVVAFAEPATKRWELNFVKMHLAANRGNAVVAVYGARVADAQAKAFLDEHSSAIGKALEGLVMPDLGGLPKREF